MCRRSQEKIRIYRVFLGLLVALVVAGFWVTWTNVGVYKKQKYLMRYDAGERSLLYLVMTLSFHCTVSLFWEAFFFFFFSFIRLVTTFPFNTYFIYFFFVLKVLCFIASPSETFVLFILKDQNSYFASSTHFRRWW